MDTTDYRQKYLKYKLKYLELCKQISGDVYNEIIKLICELKNDILRSGDFRNLNIRLSNLNKEEIKKIIKFGNNYIKEIEQKKYIEEIEKITEIGKIEKIMELINKEGFATLGNKTYNIITFLKKREKDYQNYESKLVCENKESYNITSILSEICPKICNQHCNDIKENNKKNNKKCIACLNEHNKNVANTLKKIAKYISDILQILKKKQKELEKKQKSKKNQSKK